MGNQIGARPRFAEDLVSYSRSYSPAATTRTLITLWHSRPEFCPSVCFVGRDVFCHENWRGVIPTADSGRYAALLGGIGVVPALALAHAHPSNGGTMEDCGTHRYAAALGRKRRSVLGRADSAVGDSGPAGSHGNALDGDCGLAQARRAQAFGAYSVRNRDGFRGNGDPDWAGEIGIIRPRRFDRCGSADSGVAGVGLRVALFQARDTSQFAYAGRGDAGIVRRGDAVDY